MKRSCKHCGSEDVTLMTKISTKQQRRITMAKKYSGSESAAEEKREAKAEKAAKAKMKSKKKKGKK